MAEQIGPKEQHRRPASVGRSSTRAGRPRAGPWAWVKAYLAAIRSHQVGANAPSQGNAASEFGVSETPNCGLGGVSGAPPFMQQPGQARDEVETTARNCPEPGHFSPDLLEVGAE